MTRRITLVLAVTLTLSVGACTITPPPALDQASVEGRLVSKLPSGWAVRGPIVGVRPNYIGVFVDSKILREGKVSACILSLDAVHRDWGELSQRFYADRYRGKRVRFGAWVRTNRVTNWAGLFTSVGTASTQDVAFDDMSDRPLEGTTDWKWCETVLDVWDNAVLITIGVRLHGSGQVWIDGGRFEVVDKSVPVTDQFPVGRPRAMEVPHRLLDEPVDLGFEDAAPE